MELVSRLRTVSLTVLPHLAQSVMSDAAVREFTAETARSRSAVRPGPEDLNNRLWALIHSSTASLMRAYA
jgi:hypothetical protein